MFTLRVSPSVRLASAVSLLLAAPSAADVLVVDPGGGTPFQDVQPAIAAAAEGDSILIRSGNYPGVLIQNKGVDLVADSGAAVVFDGVVRVLNLAAGKSVLLQGLRVEGTNASALFAGHGLLLSGNAGAVRAEACTFIGADNLDGPAGCEGLGDNSGWEGVLVLNSSDVVLEGCELRAGNGVIQRNEDLFGDDCGFYTPGGDGGNGLEATDSTVAVYGCSLFAGLGGYGGFGGRGGDAVRAAGGSVFVSGSLLEGGEGGYGFDFLAGDGGAGGHGVFSFFETVTAEVLDSTLVGGLGGGSFAFSPGADGQAFAGAVTMQTFAGGARGVDSPSPVRVGEAFDVSFDGEPSDFVFLMVGGQDLHLALPDFAGLLLQLPIVTLAVGNLDGAGELDLPLVLNPLGAGTSAATLVLQSFHLSTGLEARIGGARHLVVLAAGL